MLDTILILSLPLTFVTLQSGVSFPMSARLILSKNPNNFCYGTLHPHPFNSEKSVKTKSFLKPCFSGSKCLFQTENLLNLRRDNKLIYKFVPLNFINAKKFIFKKFRL